MACGVWCPKCALYFNSKKNINYAYALNLLCPYLTSSILNIGRWSEKGCTRNTKLSSASKTVCDCNHLTHFAILLSPNPPEFSSNVELSLTLIGYIGVSVSLVAMTVTVLTFLTLK